MTKRAYKARLLFKPWPMRSVATFLPDVAGMADTAHGGTQVGFSR